MNIQRFRSRGIKLAFLWGMVAGGVIGFVIGGISWWSHTDWQKFSEGWFIQRFIVAAAIGTLCAVAGSLIAASVAILNAGKRPSVVIQTAWLIESVMWVVLGGQEVVALLYMSGISRQMFDFSLPVALFCALFGAGAGWIGLRCAARDTRKTPLVRKPLLGLALGFIMMQIVVVAVWGVIVMIDRL